jgi:hypothetical protein
MRAELTATLGSRGKPAPEWKPLRLFDFAWERAVLAFDQSLTNCGWVRFTIYSGKIVVYSRGTLRPSVSTIGFVGTWDKAAKLRKDLAMILSWYPGVDVVYENPAVHGHRLESSLLAGQVLYELAGERGYHIDAQHACKVLCGRPLRSGDRKKAIRLSVARYIPGSETRAWNEHQRDAAALGLTHLHDLRQAA